GRRPGRQCSRPRAWSATHVGGGKPPSPIFCQNSASFYVGNRSAERAGGPIMRRRPSIALRAALAGWVLFIGAGSAGAQITTCRNTGDFNSWLAKFKQEAEQQGISRAAIAAASPYLVYDQRIVNIDRGQKFFAQDFLQFSDKMLAGGRVPNGQAQMKKHAATFAREEQQYGVPAAVITGFWGLESDFGANQGKDNSIRSLTTLAYDCRRSEMFRGHLFDALRLIER